jgi:hypothetical protein
MILKTTSQRFATCVAKKTPLTFRGTQLIAPWRFSRVLEVKFVMAQEKRRFFRAARTGFEVENPAENFRKEAL